MSVNKNIMLTLTEAEIEQLENLSFIMGCSKSRVVSQALNMLSSELKMLKSEETPNQTGGKDAIHKA